MISQMPTRKSDNGQQRRQINTVMVLLLKDLVTIKLLVTKTGIKKELILPYDQQDDPSTDCVRRLIKQYQRRFLSDVIPMRITLFGAPATISDNNNNNKQRHYYLEMANKVNQPTFVDKRRRDEVIDIILGTVSACATVKYWHVSDEICSVLYKNFKSTDWELHRNQLRFELES